MTETRPWWNIGVSQFSVDRLASLVLAAERERDTARAEAGACRSEAIENKVQLLNVQRDLEHTNAERLRLQAEVELMRPVIEASRAYNNALTEHDEDDEDVLEAGRRWFLAVTAYGSR